MDRIDEAGEGVKRFSPLCGPKTLKTWRWKGEAPQGEFDVLDYYAEGIGLDELDPHDGEIIRCAGEGCEETDWIGDFAECGCCGVRFCAECLSLDGPDDDLTCEVCRDHQREEACEELHAIRRGIPAAISAPEWRDEA